MKYSPILTALLLPVLILCGCLPATPSDAKAAEPTLTETITLQSPPTLEPTLTPTNAPANEPAGNAIDSPALTIEENKLEGEVELDPLTFKPVNGSQEALMARHAQAQEKPFPFETDFENDYQVMYPVVGDRQYKAVEGELRDGEIFRTKTTLEQNGKAIFEVNTGEVSPIPVMRGLWVEGGHWTLELASTVNQSNGNEVRTDATGQIYQDGILLNQQYGYQEMFGFQFLDGKPFYFYRKDGLIHLSYDGQDLNLVYNQVPHYGCCSGAETNPVAAPNWVRFFGLRDGVWYFTQIGRY